jgi:hypothetical protein
MAKSKYDDQSGNFDDQSGTPVALSPKEVAANREAYRKQEAARKLDEEAANSFDDQNLPSPTPAQKRQEAMKPPQKKPAELTPYNARWRNRPDSGFE